MISNPQLEEMKSQIKHLTNLNKKEMEKSGDFIQKHQKV